MFWLLAFKIIASLAAWGFAAGLAAAAVYHCRRRAWEFALAFGLLALAYTAGAAYAMHMIWEGQ